MPPQAGGPGGPPQSRQISAADSGNAVWRADGKEIFYLAADGKVMAAPVASGENFFVRAHRRGSSKRSWRRALFGVTTSRVTASDFSVNVRMSDIGSEPITVIVNWPKLLDQTR
jgi:hypothetical protein